MEVPSDVFSFINTIKSSSLFAETIPKSEIFAAMGGPHGNFEGGCASREITSLSIQNDNHHEIAMKTTMKSP